MDINFENPNSLSAAKSRTAVQSAPLWDIKETFPEAGMRVEKLALSRTAGSGLITPRQLGPTTRMSASLQMETIRFSISSPSWPTSRKPAETITIPLIPFSTASFTAFSAGFGGRIIIARSTASGISPIEGYAFTLDIAFALGFTG